jgi:predicted GIY-YIG superfamily endonuclease
MTLGLTSSAHARALIPDVPRSGGQDGSGTALPYYVYVLKHPTTDEIRYVGQTNDPVARFEEHLRAEGRTHRVSWIRSVFNNGSCPKMEVVFWDLDTRERACLMEMNLIAALRAVGTRLCNGTDGGETGDNPRGRKRKYKLRRRRHGHGRHRSAQAKS